MDSQILGRVQSSTGAALAGVRIRIPGRTPPSLATSDVNGAFEISGPPGERRIALFAEVAGFAPRWSEHEIHSSGPGIARTFSQPIVLDRGGALEFIVRSANSGAGPISVEVLTGTGSALGRVWAGRELRTELDTPQSLGLLPPGRYRLEFQGPGLAPRTLHDVVVRTGNNTELGEVWMVRGRPLEGLVLDDAGLPVAGAQIRFSAVESSISGLPLPRSTDLSGAFRAEHVPETSLRIEAQAAGFLRTTVERAASETQPLEIRLRRGLSLYGRLITSEGLAVAEATGAAVLRRVDGRDAPLSANLTGGQFEFAGLDLGKHQLTVELTNGQTIQHACELSELASSHILQLELPDRTLLRGRVLSETRRAPIDNAEIQVLTPGSGGRTRSDAEGRFELTATPLVDGLRMLVRHPEYPDAVVEVAAGRTGEVEELEILLLAGGQLSGSLRQAEVEGKPASVVALLSPGRLWTTRVDSEGGYSFASLPPGSYFVRAYRGELRALMDGPLAWLFEPRPTWPQADVVVASSRPASFNLDITEIPAGTVTLSVELGNDSGLSAVTATLRALGSSARAASSRGLRAEQTVSPTGQVDWEFLDVPHGSYRLTLTAGGTRRVLHTTEFALDSPRSELGPFRPRLFDLQLTVQGADDGPVVLELRQPGHRPQRQTVQNGTQRLPGLGAGAVELEFFSNGSSLWTSELELVDRWTSHDVSLPAR